jgi:Peptidase family M28
MPNSAFLCFCLFAAVPALAQYKMVNPQIAKIVSEISDQRVADVQKKLEGFETRYIFSSQTNPTRGIGAARKWIYDQFRSYSPRLEVSYDEHRLKKDESRGSRVLSDVDLYNVVAVLPGSSSSEQRIIVSGHYDSLVIERAANAPPPQPGDPLPKRDPELPAPGVTDDGSGTACVLELARVMSQYQFEKTLVFIAFAGEEEGLLGSTLYAEKAHKDNQKIEAVLNNDIIGSILSGNGGMDNLRLNVFSEEPSDSGSRELARYIRDMGDRYLPSMRVELIFRADRFGRGGDHTPFNQEGFAAVRFSSPMEDYAHQHSVTDTFANTSSPYVAQVARVNAAAAAALAWAPKPPQTSEMVDRNGQKVPSLLLTRGKSRYDAALKWKQENPEPDLAGYAIVMRSTTSSNWDREIFVGNVTEYTMPSVSIDEYIFGVKAVDKDGNESLVSPYIQVPRAKRPIPVY